MQRNLPANSENKYVIPRYFSAVNSLRKTFPPHKGALGWNLYAICYHIKRRDYSMIYQTSMATPIGDLVIQSNETAVVSVSFQSEASTALFPAAIMVSGKTMPAVLQQAVEELREYFSGQRKAFTVPLYMEGTEFRMKAWKALQAIPYGEVRSYQQQAEAIGNRKATRAIGGANPVSYTHLRAHETRHDLVCRLLLEKKK